jgi:N-acetylglucosaminyl-diphospho-decaprenol L-rhamnosyltransferase
VAIHVPMILSVVIVNYNVKFFLEQCLSSLKKALKGSRLLGEDTEVYIVDNASSDGSLDFLEPRFPEFHFIRNEMNTGFAKANNQALLRCQGEFVLFLNPDTILAENCLDICVSFLQKTKDAGALGVHMVDGAGKYLKESKRGFPTTRSSFFKMTGIIHLFPTSKFFSGYYMGHVGNNLPARVDILSGAFMMVRKSVLDITGGFDELFFMYAEDIDLSYRISQSGFRNYYLPSANIIHFKGESTKKNFLYTKMFHEAMEKFIHKHFVGSAAKLKRISLYAGIRLHRAVNNVRLFFKIKEKKTAWAMPVFLKGGADIQAQWAAVLQSKKMSITQDESKAGKIIFCEGPDLSWTSIIEDIQNNRNHTLYMFHGAGTQAAVGSHSSKDQGEIIEI